MQFQYGRQNIEHVRKQTKPPLNRLESEDERNVSGGANDNQSDVVDGIREKTSDLTISEHGEFKKPFLPSEKPVKRKHKKHNSNGNNVISRDDAMILVPDGVQSTEGFTFVRTPRGSDNENSDTEVSVKH